MLGKSEPTNEAVVNRGIWTSRLSCVNPIECDALFPAVLEYEQPMEKTRSMVVHRIHAQMTGVKCGEQGELGVTVQEHIHGFATLGQAVQGAFTCLGGKSRQVKISETFLGNGSPKFLYEGAVIRNKGCATHWRTFIPILQFAR